MTDLVIGLDFDNTIVSYDDTFHAAATERGLITPDTPATKTAVRDAVRRNPDGELRWQEIQALVYGPMMPQATLIDGVADFVGRCRREGCALYIVSHKTEHAAQDHSGVNLRDAARDWMKRHRFFADDGLGFRESDVWFESTRRDKTTRILSNILSPTTWMNLKKVVFYSSLPTESEAHRKEIAPAVMRLKRYCTIITFARSFLHQSACGASCLRLAMKFMNLPSAMKVRVEWPLRWSPR